ncbi:hypothetical protein ILUMI_26134 [Ignelater luminosus]|uniref:Uncharacterized protein n=1 Tax=Ignelater luminosus TaxID=2038154 RepID=A0A8K0FW11_IGNLU|nr:hypothetical protein ILUMI_26134 [Ignelater luminosus]
MFEVADYFPKCFIDDPNLNNCLLEAFDTVRPYIKKGVEEIGIVPFERIVFPNFNMTQETTIIYEMSGRLLQVPIRGNGLMTAALRCLNAKIEIKGRLVLVENVEYYNTTKIKVTINSIQDGNFTLDGLFGGDETLGSTTMAKLNRHRLKIIRACIPGMEKVSEEKFMRFMKSFTGSVPGLSKQISGQSIKGGLANCKENFQISEGTSNYGICYSGVNLEPQTYSDADYTADVDTRKSISGSTAEAKYVSASDAAQKSQWLRTFLKSFEGPVTLFVDNRVAIQRRKGTEHHKHSKHIDVRYHHIRHCIEDSDLKVDRTTDSRYDDEGVDGNLATS